MSVVLRVVQIVPDDRDMFRNYELPEPYFGSAPTALLEGLSEWNDSVEVHVISCVRKRMPAPPQLAGNIFYHQVLVSGGYRRTLFFEAVRKVRKKIREINPDFVNGHGTEDYPALCAAFSGYPNCITLHGNMRAVARKLHYRPFHRVPLDALCEAVALKKTDAVICNSSYTERCVGRLNSKKVRIPNAVRSSFFTHDQYRNSIQSGFEPDGKKTLLCVGEVVPYKNQIGLIHALDELASVERFRLQFVGRCNAESAYGQRFLKEISRREWCEHIGSVDERTLQEMFASCAGLVHPTLEDSFGLVMAEAQVLGVPVVASAVGGILDLICDGETGFLFDPGNRKEICDKVRLLLLTKRPFRICEKAGAVARDQYAPRCVAEAHLEFYSSMTGKVFYLNQSRDKWSF